MNLGPAGGGVGEHKASAETKREASGFQRVSAGRDVVHKVGLAESQGFARSGKVVLLGLDGAKRVFVLVFCLLAFMVFFCFYCCSASDCRPSPTKRAEQGGPWE